MWFCHIFATFMWYFSCRKTFCSESLIVRKKWFFFKSKFMNREKNTHSFPVSTLFWGFPRNTPDNWTVASNIFLGCPEISIFSVFFVFFFENHMAPNWYFLQEFYVCSLKFGLFSDNFWKGSHENFWKKIWGVIERTYIRCQINFFFMLSTF